MIGYHYTSYSNWKKIKKEGLIPYILDNPELRRVFGKKVRGVWLWPKRLKGISHSGSIIFQVSSKNTGTVVLLKLKYNKKNLLCSYNGEKVVLYHYGAIGNFDYHIGKDEALVICSPIPASDIDLVDTYNLFQAWK